MSFEYDPLVILQKEILRTREARINPRPNKKYSFRVEDEYISDDSDQEFINSYVSNSEFFPDKY